MEEVVSYTISIGTCLHEGDREDEHGGSKWASPTFAVPSKKDNKIRIVYGYNANKKETLSYTKDTQNDAEEEW